VVISLIGRAKVSIGRLNQQPLTSNTYGEEAETSMSTKTVERTPRLTEVRYRLVNDDAGVRVIEVMWVTDDEASGGPVHITEDMVPKVWGGLDEVFLELQRENRQVSNQRKSSDDKRRARLPGP
jgi:hypothetical protein